MGRGLLGLRAAASSSDAGFVEGPAHRRLGAAGELGKLSQRSTCLIFSSDVFH